LKAGIQNGKRRRNPGAGIRIPTTATGSIEVLRGRGTGRANETGLHAVACIALVLSSTFTGGVNVSANTRIFTPAMLSLTVRPFFFGVPKILIY
jgi:hypothetical protein